MLWTIPLGLVVGLTMGALGGGGAVIAVPALVYLLHQPPAAATTGSLLVVGVTAVVSVVQHRRRVRWKEGTVFGLLGIIGSYAGSRLAQLTRPELLLLLFAALLLVVAALMIRRVRRGEPEEPTRRGPLAIGAAAIGVGALTGFFGVGGGFAVVPALTLLLGYAMPAAVATSLLVMVINCAGSLATRLALGVPGLDLPLLALFAAFAIVGSLLGGRLTARVAPRRLQGAFAALLVAIAVAMGAETAVSLLRA